MNTFSMQLRWTRVAPVAVALMVFSVLSCAARAEPPALIPDTQTIEIGELRVGEIRQIEMSVSNPTDSPLSLGPVVSSCSCTVVTLDEQVLSPGASAVVRAEVHHAHFVTPDVRSVITVRTLGEQPAEASFVVRGTLLPPYFSQPPAVAIDGDDQTGAAYTVTALGRDSTDFVTNLVDKPHWLDVHPGTEPHTYLVRLSEPVQVDLLQGEIALTTGDGRQEVLRVPVTVRRREVQYALTPPVLLLGDVRRGHEASAATLRVDENTSVGPIEAGALGVVFMVEPGAQAGEFHLVPHVRADAAEGSMAGKVRMILRNGTRERAVEMGVLGNVLASAD